jgi:hypothetical protein
VLQGSRQHHFTRTGPLTKARSDVHGIPDESGIREPGPSSGRSDHASLVETDTKASKQAKPLAPHIGEFAKSSKHFLRGAEGLLRALGMPMFHAEPDQQTAAVRLKDRAFVLIRNFREERTVLVQHGLEALRSDIFAEAIEATQGG